MKKPAYQWIAVLAGVGFWLSAAPSEALPGPEEDAYEVLTRGPVHEAFAESVNFEPEPGIIVTSEPPAPIEELPPEIRPEGDNVTWIPGYWWWDEDDDDFLWVSGVWRNLPPDRQWIPGYWSDVGGGQWQWVAGYWADAELDEVAYIATAPPEPVGAGPNIAAPTPEHSWIPGIWIWSDSRYVWRPGYWSPLRDDWTWVPARYVWTPRGYVFIDGYWDHSIDHRGVVFAPVHFHGDVWRRSGYHYRPSVVVEMAAFIEHLFYRPRASHYYFGDYYDSRYRAWGLNPVYAWHSRRGYYDPVYAHQRWRHRGDRNWERDCRRRFDFLREHATARPPRTWSAMRKLASDGGGTSGRVFASTLGRFAETKGKAYRFGKLRKPDLEKIARQRIEENRFRKTREKLETHRRGGKVGKGLLKQQLSRAPIQSRVRDRIDKSERPPARLEPKVKTLRTSMAQRLKEARERLRGNRGHPAAKSSGNRSKDRLKALRDQWRQRLKDRQPRGGARRGPARRDAPPAKHDRGRHGKASHPDRTPKANPIHRSTESRGKARAPQKSRSRGATRARGGKHERARPAPRRPQPQVRRPSARPRPGSHKPKARAGRSARSRAKASRHGASRHGASGHGAGRGSKAHGRGHGRRK